MHPKVFHVCNLLAAWLESEHVPLAPTRWMCLPSHFLLTHSSTSHISSCTSPDKAHLLVELAAQLATPEATVPMHKRPARCRSRPRRWQGAHVGDIDYLIAALKVACDPGGHRNNWFQPLERANYRNRRDRRGHRRTLHTHTRSTSTARSLLRISAVRVRFDVFFCCGYQNQPNPLCIHLLCSRQVAGRRARAHAYRCAGARASTRSTRRLEHGG